MNIFLKVVRMSRNGSGSFGIDTKTIPKKFGGPTMFRTPNIDLVPSQSQNVRYESEILWNQVRLDLRLSGTKRLPALYGLLLLQTGSRV